MNQVHLAAGVSRTAPEFTHQDSCSGISITNLSKPSGPSAATNALLTPIHQPTAPPLPQHTHELNPPPLTPLRCIRLSILPQQKRHIGHYHSQSKPPAHPAATTHSPQAGLNSSNRSLGNDGTTRPQISRSGWSVNRLIRFSARACVLSRLRWCVSGVVRM